MDSDKKLAAVEQSRRGDDAKRLIENPVWSDIWQRMGAYLDDREQSCDTTNKDLAADIVRCKQLLLGIQREAVRIVSEGKMANLRIKEIEKKETVMERVFKR